MSKKNRSMFAAVAGGLVLVVLIVLGRTDVSAQGGQAEEPEPARSEASATVVLSEDREEAIEMATQVPEEWDYDPSDRVIYKEDANLDYAIERSEREWRQMLNDNEFYILREKGTERAFTHPLDDNKQTGIYYSRATGQPLFHSDDKYDSGTGWPSFTKPIGPHAVVYVEDNSLFAMRIEVVDSLSGSHLGHVFRDGPDPTGQRYCMNGTALIFVPEGEDPPEILPAMASR